MYAYVFIRLPTYIPMYAYIHMYVSIYMYMYFFSYIYKYIYTYKYKSCGAPSQSVSPLLPFKFQCLFTHASEL